MKRTRGIDQLLQVMRRLRGPGGCPWDREQDHQSIRFHAIEEVYELIDAIEASDDHEMEEELGDLLLQVVFHSQLARERGAFDFEKVAQREAEKLIRRHPHVFGTAKVRDVDGVWAQWEKIKREEKQGTRHERPSAFDGIPRHLPSLLRAQKLVKKAQKSGFKVRGSQRVAGKSGLAKALFELAQEAQLRGWSAEELLRQESYRREKSWRRQERHKKPKNRKREH